MLRSSRHVGLRDPHARQALLEVGVDGRRSRRGPVRTPRLERRRYHHVASEQRGQHGGGDEGQRRRQEDEEHEHADAGEDADDGVDEAGLEELRQRLDVGGHAGHDPAAQLAVVVVERQPLEVGEDPDPQRVEQALGGAAGDAACRPT